MDQPDTKLAPWQRTMWPLVPVSTFRPLSATVKVEIAAECHAGICGSDPIRIISGGENLNEVGGGESDTLQDICGLKPGECRLACVTKPKGPVVVEIITQ